MKPFSVYILQCADASFYVGHTDDLETRRAQHQSGQTPGYTASRLPVTLVHVEELATRIEAIEREQQLKGWSRHKKQALIDHDFQRLHLLARPSTSLRANGTKDGQDE
jgi:predicted GIY-YIG superfamily endonuclease